jgi:hypothetical protein
MFCTKTEVFIQVSIFSTLSSSIHVIQLTLWIKLRAVRRSTLLSHCTSFAVAVEEGILKPPTLQAATIRRLPAEIPIMYAIFLNILGDNSIVFGIILDIVCIIGDNEFAPFLQS